VEADVHRGQGVPHVRDTLFRMSLSVQDQEVGGVTVVRPAGRLTLSDSNGALKHAINSLVEAGRARFVLNLEGVPYVDSSGLGEIASAHVTVSRTGGQLLLAAVPDRVMDETHARALSAPRRKIRRRQTARLRISPSSAAAAPARAEKRRCRRAGGSRPKECCDEALHSPRAKPALHLRACSARYH
jgi:anti-sigma B factor antagonist